MEMQYQNEIQEMITILKDAAKNEILPRIGNAKSEIKKETSTNYNDTITDADKGASKYIMNHIISKFPGSYTEEDKNNERFNHDLIWQIDPLDGTLEFSSGMLDGFSMNAALLKKRLDETYFPVAGILYLPGVNKLIYSDGINICFLNNDKEVNFTKLSRYKLIGWTRKVYPSNKHTEVYNKLGEMLNVKIEIFHGGGAGASLLELIEGKTNLVIMNYDNTLEWDIAMAEPIIKSLGGFICDLDGNEFTYNKEDGPHGDLYNLRGYVMCIAFKKDEIMDLVSKENLLQSLL